ncbi:hypothetical protein LOK49_LG12G01502 [Camellia lanceoleosa]|uniref:Uncharacterized protein n=1 Tax=Camellia lanceoleosa TaxID=1840588 RepID=A0ACC0FQY1_9ERIC|nr:hypothetical protein LOK49_LG12G01502 [Camellia lanceoleosa]
MPFLNLSKRLQPAKKAWKIFTSKFNIKPHKLNSSKSIIKKSKTRLKTKNNSKPLPWPALPFQSPRLHRKRLTNSIQSTHVLRRHHRLHKRSAQVYIDGLFVEPTTSNKQRLIAEKKCSTSTGSEEKAKIHEQPAVGDDVPGTSKEGEADDMWESLGLESPLMDGINERAEEFITRIRAEMQMQETMAPQL